MNFAFFSRKNFSNLLAPRSRAKGNICWTYRSGFCTRILLGHKRLDGYALCAELRWKKTLVYDYNRLRRTRHEREWNRHRLENCNEINCSRYSFDFRSANRYRCSCSEINIIKHFRRNTFTSNFEFSSFSFSVSSHCRYPVPRTIFFYSPHCAKNDKKKSWKLN